MRSKKAILPYFVAKLYPFFEIDPSGLNFAKSALSWGIKRFGSLRISFN